MDFVFLFLTSLYALALLIATRGWKNALATPKGNEVKPFVSVIVPFRNEAHHLPSLLTCLQRQRYPAFEVIFVNDHSEDAFYPVMEPFLVQLNYIHLIDVEGAGKKQAIISGVSHAKGEIMITTDADCDMTPTWIEDIVSRFSPTTSMVCGGVAMLGNRFFHALQSIEWCSLVGVTAASIGFKNPVMCSGANLAFRKAVFEEVNGYEGNLHIASGDDEFLMRKILTQYPDGIAYSSRSTSVVKTQALDSIAAFFQQRVRWAQKWKYNTSTAAIFMAFCILGFQVMWLLLFWRCLMMGNGIAAICLVMRALSEIYFLYPVCKHLNTRWNWIAFFVLQWIYPVYVITVGVLSNVVSITWRGRKIV
jgi:biofilm PGA synthesis N-glycosyltransferase PgaC